MTGDTSEGMVAFLGVEADRRLLREDGVNLPDAEQHHDPVISTHKHDRLVTAGSTLTGATLVGGVAMIVYGGGQVLLKGGGGFDVILAVIGILLVGTHWGWVHIAEYVGLVIDEHQQHGADARSREWLETIAPYPRFSVSTSVLSDASTRVERVLHRPILTPQQTFTFVRETAAEKIYDADTSAEVIAAGVETMRRRARLETDRLRARWEAAASVYEDTLLSAEDDQQRLIAQRAAAVALSEHINASLRDPPLVE